MNSEVKTIVQPEIEEAIPGDEPSVKYTKAEKKGGKRIGYNYIILKSLKESKKNDVVKCIYIKSLTNWGICVIKEGTYGDTKDKHGRDIKDRLIWQKELHEMLQDKVRMPRLLGSFEENGNYYLVMERIKGKALATIIRERGFEICKHLQTGSKLALEPLDWLLQVTSLLRALHSYGVVHRDVTAANFMVMPGGEVAVIDMELSYSLENRFPNPPFQLGTYGYMSPEQETLGIPAYDQDVFSLGAIIFYIWTAISPSKVAGIAGEELNRKLAFLISDKQTADMVYKCMDPVPNNRPDLNSIVKLIRQHKEDILKARPRQQSTPTLYSRNDIANAVRRSIYALGTPLFSDQERGWFADNLKKDLGNDRDKLQKAWYSSFNVGVGGIIYFLSRAALVGMDVSNTEDSLQKAIALIKLKYIANMGRTSPGLHVGSDGIAVALAVGIQQGLIHADDTLVEAIPRLLERSTGLLGFFDGMAGQGMANMYCQQFLSPDSDRLKEICTGLIERQGLDGSWTFSKRKYKHVIIPGIGYGMAGIIGFLLAYGDRYKDDKALYAAEKGLNWLMQHAVKKKGAIDWRTKKGKNIFPSFSHGATGISLVFWKAYRIYKSPAYKMFAERSLRMIDDRMNLGNLRQLNGLSGLGEVYLEAFSITGNAEWAEKSAMVAQVIMHMKRIDQDHGDYWLVDRERQPVGGFMGGNSGILHYLLRFLHPEEIGVPLFL